MKTTANTTITGFQSKKFPGKYVMLVSHGRMMNHSSANPNHAKMFDIKFIVLNEHYDGGQPNPSHYDLSDDSNFEVSRISSGELFLATGGSVWLDGVLQWYPKSNSSKKSDNKGLSLATLVGNKGYIAKSGSLKKYLGLYEAFFDENALMYVSKQENGTKLLIPAVELFRFYWSGSKSFTSDLLNKKVENLDSFCVINDSKLRVNGDVQVVVRAKYRLGDARMIARMICSNRHHKDDKYSIAHRSAMHPFVMWTDKTKPTFIQANFPFNDETTITGYGISLPGGDLLVLGIARCSHSFPFAEIYARMDIIPIEVVSSSQDGDQQSGGSVTVYEDNAPFVTVNSNQASDEYRHTEDINVEDGRFNIPKTKKMHNQNKKKQRCDSGGSGLLTHEKVSPGQQSLTPGGSAGDLPSTNLKNNDIADNPNDDKSKDKEPPTVIDVAKRVVNLFNCLKAWHESNHVIIDGIEIVNVTWRYEGEPLDIKVEGLKATGCPYLPIDSSSNEDIQKDENNQRSYGSRLRWVAVIEATVSVDGVIRVYYLIEVCAKNSGYALNLLFKPVGFSVLDKSEFSMLINGFRKYFSKQSNLVSVFDIRDKNQANIINRVAVNHSRRESSKALAMKVMGRLK